MNKKKKLEVILALYVIALLLIVGFIQVYIIEAKPKPVYDRDGIYDLPQDMKDQIDEMVRNTTLVDKDDFLRDAGFN